MLGVKDVVTGAADADGGCDTRTLIALHAEVARLLKQQGFDAEVTVDQDGSLETSYGRPGSIRLDVPEVRGNDLYIYDFKAGNAKLTRARIRQIKDSARKMTKDFDKIVVIEVKL